MRWGWLAGSSRLPTLPAVTGRAISVAREKTGWPGLYECCLYRPLRGQARTQDYLRAEECGVPVGAGLPAKRPVQSYC
ncbi:hypothetical protein AL532_05905 [Pseudomonas monteilii]|uniref:Uncharacterized protein n=1 Tax=Pseudomonas monteilii TaxID=76759 RepID=A0A6G6USZ0_9PSED|nr:hypothetical protein AL532_05905 [Pseudomonas monteilii]MVF52639.1 hypothetical protein [Pseudomonas monteilii]QIG16564.1 hypothetical protein FY041_01780 [Pseudomonas monteilii]QIG21824.1 hypothetical protein FY043_01780 [Pseudomonas monteilii]